MSDVRVRFDYDLSDFEKNVENFIKEAQEETLETLRYCAKVFANYASRATPPNMGRPAIDKKYYTRPWVSLLKLIRR